MSEERRKTSLVNKNFQLKFISFFIGFFFLNFAVTLILVNLSFIQLDGIQDIVGGQMSESVSKFINHQLLRLNIVLSLGALVTLFLTFVGGLWLSNKVAGPIHRIIFQMDEVIRTGRTQGFRIREDDFFKELPETLNEYTSHIENSKDSKVS